MTTITVPGGMTIITATDGRKAHAPEHFAAKWSQKVKDRMVADAHGTSPIARATARTCGLLPA